MISLIILVAQNYKGRVARILDVTVLDQDLWQLQEVGGPKSNNIQIYTGLCWDQPMGLLHHTLF